MTSPRGNIETKRTKRKAKALKLTPVVLHKKYYNLLMNDLSIKTRNNDLTHCKTVSEVDKNLVSTSIKTCNMSKSKTM